MKLRYNWASAGFGHALARPLEAAFTNVLALQRHGASVKPHPDPAIPETMTVVPHCGNVICVGGDGTLEDGEDDPFDVPVPILVVVVVAAEEL